MEPNEFKEFKVKFCHLRPSPSGNKQKPPPLVTLCGLIRGKKIIARGVAICSPKDHPNRKIGRAIALGRAKKALRNPKPVNGIIMRVEAQETCRKVGIDPIGGPIRYKEIRLED